MTHSSIHTPWSHELSWEFFDNLFSKLEDPENIAKLAPKYPNMVLGKNKPYNETEMTSFLLDLGIPFSDSVPLIDWFEWNTIDDFFAYLNEESEKYPRIINESTLDGVSDATQDMVAQLWELPWTTKKSILNGVSDSAQDMAAYLWELPWGKYWRTAVKWVGYTWAAAGAVWLGVVLENENLKELPQSCHTAIAVLADALDKRAEQVNYDLSKNSKWSIGNTSITIRSINWYRDAVKASLDIYSASPDSSKARLDSILRVTELFWWVARGNHYLTDYKTEKEKHNWLQRIDDDLVKPLLASLDEQYKKIQWA